MSWDSKQVNSFQFLDRSLDLATEEACSEALATFWPLRLLLGHPEGASKSVGVSRPCMRGEGVSGFLVYTDGMCRKDRKANFSPLSLIDEVD